MEKYSMNTLKYQNPEEEFGTWDEYILCAGGILFNLYLDLSTSALDLAFNKLPSMGFANKEYMKDIIWGQCSLN